MNCDIQKCKAECCGAVPLPRPFKRFSFARKCEVKDFDDFFIACDDDLVCGFLDENHKCSIYEMRPEVCRKFGDASHSLLVCEFLK